MLQEVKAVNFTLEVNLDFIWRDAIKFCTKHNKVKGGTALLINAKWRDSILNYGHSPCNRAVWVLFKVNNSIFGVCSV